MASYSAAEANITYVGSGTRKKQRLDSGSKFFRRMSSFSFGRWRFSNSDYTDCVNGSEKKTRRRRRKRSPLRCFQHCFLLRCFEFMGNPVDQASSVFDADGDEVEYGPVRYVPHSLDTLTKTTKFSKEELKTMYRTFKNECPTGVVYEETFKSIYSQFFPSGDASMYAHYIFNAFDTNQEGFICFEDFVTSLSSLLRGKLEEKLQWTFKLYDINKDGFITKDELLDIIKSVHALYGPKSDGPDCMLQANKVFCKLDRNGDGYVTYAEFLEACQNDDSIVSSMKVFEAEM